MITRARKNANGLREECRGEGGKIGQRICCGVPESKQRFRGNGLSQAHHGLAIRKRENLNGTAEDRARERSEPRQRIAILYVQGGCIDRDDPLESSTNPNGRTIGAQSSAA